jgi:hypothetical protein
MLLDQQSKFVRKSENFEQQSFTIKATAKSFQILSDSLYTNKIAAIVRELSCNAVDSHVAAGNDEPFHIYLPTNSCLEFRIRDFGTGLSHEDIYNVYTKYFESTKTNSNDFIGALGLGSKTPFCYTDNFIVQSYFGGIKRSYAAFISDEGLPSISLISEEPTEEKNGVEISFAVKSVDANHFSRNAYEIFPFFSKNRMPKIFEGKSVINSLLEESDKGGRFTHWTSLIQSSISLSLDNGCQVEYHYGNSFAKTNNQNMIVLMGNVKYNLSLHQMVLTTDETRRFEKIFSGGVLVVPIGSVDVQASRENLSLNKQTVLFLKEAFKKIVETINFEMNEKISSCSTYIEAVLARKNFFPKMFEFDYQGFANVLWNGQRISSFITTQKYVKYVIAGSYRKNSGTRRLRIIDTSRIGLNKTSNSSAPITFFLGVDSASRIQKKLEFLYATEISNNTESTVLDSYIFDTKEEMEKAVGGVVPDSMIRYLKDMPMPPRQPRVGGGNVNRKKVNEFWVFDEKEELFNRGQIDLEEDKGVYILIDKQKKSVRPRGTGVGSSISFPVLFEFVEATAAITGDHDLDNLIGVTQSQLEKVSKSENWVSFEEHFANIYLSFLAENEDMLKRSYFDHYLRNNQCELLRFLNPDVSQESRDLLVKVVEKSELPDTSPEKILIRKYEEVKPLLKKSYDKAALCATWRLLVNWRYAISNYTGTPAGKTFGQKFDELAQKFDEYSQVEFKNLAKIDKEGTQNELFELILGSSCSALSDKAILALSKML